MKKFTILRTGLVQIIFLWLCSLSALAQVPSAMDYQVMATNPKTGQVLANKELLLKVEIRLNSEDGETIWSKEEKLTSSKSGICTMSLDLANIDWTLGSYYVKAFIDGDPIGASQIKSVPFALVADGINGVITKHKLVGTWVNTTVGGKEGTYIYTFNFNQDGTFSYSEKDDYGTDAYTGTWKLNNLGNIIFDIVNGKYHSGKTVLPTVYDKDDGGLWITGSDHTFFYEQTMFYKQK